MELKFCGQDGGSAGWQHPGTDRPLFLIGKPFDGLRQDHGNRNMAALLAPSRDAADLSFAAAMHAGGSDEGAPGIRHGRTITSITTARISAIWTAIKPAFVATRPRSFLDWPIQWTGAA